MKPLPLTLAAVLILLPGQVRGQGPAGKPAAPDSLAVVYLGQSRPVLFRIQVQVDDKHAGDVWKEQVRRWFEFLDRDGDGFLSKGELERAPNPTAILQMMRGGGFAGGRGGNITLAQMGKGPDAKITLEELLEHYRRNGAGPLQPSVTPGPGGRFFDAASDTLWKALDTDKDGRLSRKELEAAPAILARLDTDDDEMVSREELAPTNNPNGLRVFPVAGMMAPQPANNSSLFVVTTPQSAVQLSALLLAHYDRARAGKLSRAQSGLSKEDFDRLDRNGDGHLDPEELTRWADRDGDLEMVVHIKAKGRSQVQVEAPKGRPAPQDSKLSPLPDGSARVALDGSEIHVRSTTGPQGFITIAGFGNKYVQLFKSLDTKKQGYLDLKDLQAGEGRGLAGVFNLADRNGDGKLTLQELQQFMALQEGMRNSFITIQLAEQGRNLFQLLDTNRDGALNLRELREAWSRLAVLDRNGDGFITPEMVSRQFQIDVTRGQNFNGFRVLVAGLAQPQPRIPRAPLRGPLWFQRMDTNGDGEVSRREFLGTRAEFDRIDTNGDGIIDADEALRADALFREKAAPNR